MFLVERLRLVYQGMQGGWQCSFRFGRRAVPLAFSRAIEVGFPAFHRQAGGSEAASVITHTRGEELERIGLETRHELHHLLVDGFAEFHA